MAQRAATAEKAEPNRLSPRLTIEPVPESCRIANLRSELSYRDWEQLRSSVLGTAGHRCQACGHLGHRYPVDCQELWHYDPVSHIQRLESITVLCAACRRIKHLRATELTGPPDQAPLAHLAQVNGWDHTSLWRHLEDALRLWRQRSHQPWQTDLSLLARYSLHSPIHPSSLTTGVALPRAPQTCRFTNPLARMLAPSRLLEHFWRW